MARIPLGYLKQAASNRFFGPGLAVCIATGLIAGFSAFWPAPPPAQPATPKAEPAPIDVSEGMPPNLVATIKPNAKTVFGSIRELHLVDVMLKHGSVAQALDRYGDMEAPIGQPDLNDQLLYRVCVAHETLGRNDVALELYSQLAGQGSTPEIQILAKLGKARVWLKTNRKRLARVVLARAVLEDLASLPRDSTLSGEICHLMGLSCANHRTLLAGYSFEKGKAVGLLPSWTANDLLEFSEIAKDAISKKTDTPEEELSPFGVTLVYRYGNDPTEIQLSANLPRSPIEILVSQLSEVAEINVRWSDDAKTVVKGRAMQLVSASANLAVVLDTLLSKFDLLWRLENDTIDILSRSELPPADLKRLEDSVAHRLLQHAVALYPEHALAFFSHLSLGNLQFEKDSFASAISIYRNCIDRFPRTQNTSVAEFNMAKALMNDGSRTEALRMFFQVGDGSHGHPLQSPTNAYAGRILLEDGKIAEAVRPLMRSVSTAVADSDRAKSTLLLAAAYLLAENPHASAQVLMESKKEVLKSETASKLAAFLNAYAQFLVATDELGLSQAGRNLINSLGALDSLSRLDDYWYLLVGSALHDVGLSNQMAATYKSRLKKKQSAWLQEQMQIRLIEYWKENHNFSEIRRQLTGTTKPNEIIELAALDLRDGNIESCLMACRNLLDDARESELSEDHKKACLSLMGEAYQKQGVHFKAALCFAGMLPLDPVD